MKSLVNDFPESDLFEQTESFRQLSALPVFSDGADLMNNFELVNFLVTAVVYMSRKVQLGGRGSSCNALSYFPCSLERLT